MPNWCANTLVLQHDEPAMIDRAVAAFKEGRLLDEFIPVPKDLQITSGFLGDAEEQAKLEAQQQANNKKYGYATWYEYCVNEWGTKWDVGDEYGYTHSNEHMATFAFDSAWSPPINAYTKLEELGFRVDAMYYESGMGFCGIYDECGDDYYELGGMSSDEVKDAIPAGLDAEFSISESMAEWEAENPEDDEVTVWYKDGVEELGLAPHEIKANI